MKDYLESEMQRNRQNAEMFNTLLGMAFGNDFHFDIGHHLVAIKNDGPNWGGNEIPAADTLLFCPELMKAAFGDNFKAVMVTLAKASSVEERDLYLAAAIKEEQQYRWTGSRPTRTLRGEHGVTVLDGGPEYREV